MSHVITEADKQRSIQDQSARRDAVEIVSSLIRSGRLENSKASDIISLVLKLSTEFKKVHD